MHNATSTTKKGSKTGIGNEYGINGKATTPDNANQEKNGDFRKAPPNE
jgi:hypothetical protein